LAFDPNNDYNSQETLYYTLWHYKNRIWTSYGKLPSQGPIHYHRARPFQAKLETDKWGLKAGWHIFYIKSFSDYGVNMPTTQYVLRLRHVGKRILENQPNYRAPVYLDDNWEILDQFTMAYNEDLNWFVGDTLQGRGVYNKDYGLVYDGDPRHIGVQNWEEGDYVSIACWDDGRYLFRETSQGEDEVPSVALGVFAPWPGTSNEILASHFQGYSSSWPQRRVLRFFPTSRSDESPWGTSLSWPVYSSPWMLWDQRDFWTCLANSEKWRSNFWFLAESHHMAYDNSWYPDVDDYIIYQGPKYWRRFETADCVNGIPSIENSMWDWGEDGSCAESTFVSAYVRRKSDGSIWKFRNWNPATNIYTDFPNLEMKPVSPVPGIEYASFFINGPPIPGNETWNTLIVLK
jgi:hypothetical protein